MALYQYLLRFDEQHFSFIHTPAAGLKNRQEACLKRKEARLRIGNKSHDHTVKIEEEAK